MMWGKSLRYAKLFIINVIVNEFMTREIADEITLENLFNDEIKTFLLTAAKKNCDEKIFTTMMRVLKFLYTDMNFLLLK